MITLRFGPIKSINEAYIGTWLPTMTKSKKKTNNNRRMNYLWIILFRLFWKRVNRFWLTHSERKKGEKNQNKNSRALTKKETRNASLLQQNKQICLKRERENQTIIYLSSIPWKMITCAFVRCDGHTTSGGGDGPIKKHLVELNTSIRLHINRCNECSNSSVVFCRFVIVSAIDDYIPNVYWLDFMILLTMALLSVFFICKNIFISIHWLSHDFSFSPSTSSFIVVIAFSYVAPQWYSLYAWTCQVFFNGIKIWFNVDQLRFSSHWICVDFDSIFLISIWTKRLQMIARLMENTVAAVDASVIEATFSFIFNTSNQTKEQNTRMTSNHVL